MTKILREKQKIAGITLTFSKLLDRKKYLELENLLTNVQSVVPRSENILIERLTLDGKI